MGLTELAEISELARACFELEEPLIAPHPRLERRRARRERRRARMDPWRRAISSGSWDDHIGVACPVCRAAPGKHCTSRRGRLRMRSHRRRKNLARATVPACSGCGACCLASVWADGKNAAAVPFVDVLPGEQVPEELQGPHPESPTGRALRVIDGRCAALRGTVPGARCAIYDGRPAICRAFVAGSYRCRVVRARAGVERFPDGLDR